MRIGALKPARASPVLAIAANHHPFKFVWTAHLPKAVVEVQYVKGLPTDKAIILTIYCFALPSHDGSLTAGGTSQYIVVCVVFTQFVYLSKIQYKS